MQYRTLPLERSQATPIAWIDLGSVSLVPWSEVTRVLGRHHVCDPLRGDEPWTIDQGLADEEAVFAALRAAGAPWPVGLTAASFDERGLLYEKKPLGRR